MASLINIGVAGLQAQQAALAVTGQNITNASTPGYTRQTVSMVPQVSGVNGGVFQGAGARVDQVERVVDEFLQHQVRKDTALQSELSTLSEQIAQIESLVADETSGLDPAFDAFFAAMQAAANTPGSLPGRQLVLSQAGALEDRFSSLYSRLNEQLDNADETLRSSVTRLNELAAGIASLNERIESAGGNEDAGNLNAFYDQRDQLLEELATLVSVNVLRQDNQVNVFIGTGQPLLIGADANRLEVTPRGEVLLNSGRGRPGQPISQALGGGQIGGALSARDDALIPAIDRLGQIALVVAQSMNEVHGQGVDLDGQLGGTLFSDINSEAAMLSRIVGDEYNAPGIPGTISVRVDDAINADLTNYVVEISERPTGIYTITRDLDGAVVASGDIDGQFPQSVSFDNITLTFEGGRFAAGDRFFVQPLRHAARDFALDLKRPEDLALALPVRADRNLANAGDAEIAIGQIMDRSHPIFGEEGLLDPPLLVRFTSPTRYDILDNSDPGDPRHLDPPLKGLRFTPGVENDLLPNELGRTRIYAEGQNVARLPAAPSVITGLDSPSNGYVTETLTSTQTDPDTGAVVSSQAITFPPSSSARAIAEQMSALAGVTATATNEIELSGLADNGIGARFVVAVNGTRVTADSPVTLDALADAINDTPELVDSGVVALSNGERLVLRSVTGEDLTVHVTGDPTDSLTVTNAHGESMRVNGVGPGTSAAIIGTINRSSGFDFSLGGPYRFSMALDGGPPTAIELTGTYNNGAELVAGVQAAVTQAVGAGRVNVALTPGGQLVFESVNRGADATIEISGAPAASNVAVALGMSDTDAAGEDTYRAVTVGGEISAVLASDVTLTSDSGTGGNVFEPQQTAHRADLGFQLRLGGEVRTGDTFTVSFNEGGISDNRNALELVALRTRAMVGVPPVDYAQAYAQLVEFVGVTASQTNINLAAAESLLAQSETSRDSVSGVNLDEEAANLIRYEQAYNASAQVISVARDLFNVLINAVN